MSESRRKIDVGNIDTVRRPATKEALARVGTVLDQLGLLPELLDLTAEEASEYANISEDCQGEEVIGKHWRKSNQNGHVDLFIFDPSVREKMGELYAEATGFAPDLQLHGQLNFQQTIEQSDFSGTTFFLGDGENIDEIYILAMHTLASAGDTGYEMLGFAGTVGLSRLVVDAQGYPHDKTLTNEHRVIATKHIADDIAGALENLQPVISGGT